MGLRTQSSRCWAFEDNHHGASYDVERGAGAGPSKTIIADPAPRDATTPCQREHLESRGNTLKGLKDFDLEVKARIRP